MQNYNNLSDSEKADIINKLYVEEFRSFQDIAFMYHTYPNKVRRDAQKLGINIRSKSEAQRLALETGKHPHPTKGTTRNPETKQKIGRGVMNSWEHMSKEKLEQRSETARTNWDKLSEEQRKERFEKANEAVRETSRIGSKLERHLHQNLVHEGYRVERHKMQLLSNTKLHIDLFLPEKNIAIEVDGPSHSEPIWGEVALERAKTYDNKKTGLLLGKGLKLIRIKQSKDFSKARGALIAERLLKAIKEIETGTVNYLEIGDE